MSATRSRSADHTLHEPCCNMFPTSLRVDIMPTLLDLAILLRLEREAYVLGPMGQLGLASKEVNRSGRCTRGHFGSLLPYMNVVSPSLREEKRSVHSRHGLSCDTFL